MICKIVLEEMVTGVGQDKSCLVGRRLVVDGCRAMTPHGKAGACRVSCSFPPLVSSARPPTAFRHRVTQTGLPRFLSNLQHKAFQTIIISAATKVQECLPPRNLQQVRLRCRMRRPERTSSREATTPSPCQTENRDLPRRMTKKAYLVRSLRTSKARLVLSRRALALLWPTFPPSTGSSLRHGTRAL